VATFQVNSNRLDPYKNYRFRILMDGRMVAGVSKVSQIKRSADAGDKNAGNHSKFEAVTIERGVTNDPEFIGWINAVTAGSTGEDATLGRPAKDLEVELLDLQGNKARAFKLRRCWVSQSNLVPRTAPSQAGVAFASLQVEHEGLEE
jgi:phage tail-like protein